MGDSLLAEAAVEMQMANEDVYEIAEKVNVNADACAYDVEAGKDYERWSV